MKKLLYIVPVFLILFGFTIYNPFSQKEFMRSEKSPDGKYKLEIFTIKRPFAAPGDGGIGSREAYIVLFDKEGNEIGNSANKGCSYNDIEIDWLLDKNNSVFYSRGGNIKIPNDKK